MADGFSLFRHADPGLTAYVMRETLFPPFYPLLLAVVGSRKWIPAVGSRDHYDDVGACTWHLWALDQFRSSGLGANDRIFDDLRLGARNAASKPGTAQRVPVLDAHPDGPVAGRACADRKSGLWDRRLVRRIGGVLSGRATPFSIAFSATAYSDIATGAGLGEIAGRRAHSDRPGVVLLQEVGI